MLADVNAWCARRIALDGLGHDVERRSLPLKARVKLDAWDEHPLLVKESHANL